MSNIAIAIAYIVHIQCACVCVRDSTNMRHSGMRICPLLLLCSSSLVHTFMLSLQLPTLLSQLGVPCVCVFVVKGACTAGAHYGLNPSSLASSCCLSEGIWSGAPCQPGPCITFKEVSVSPSPYHSSSTASACWGSPWYARHAHFDTCVFSKCIRPFWAMLTRSEVGSLCGNYGWSHFGINVMINLDLLDIYSHWISQTQMVCKSLFTPQLGLINVLYSTLPPVNQNKVCTHILV